ncbi:MAG: 16S rRNA (guanine(527)-N(7))-methyltransferase RsmG [Spirochaetae bacterium HGW-Spirochaetae-7]|nr:MAG: 16S rRNA (guanine(527)-N(7))-methyltransferase RsmG [Spirochaetae bacterium HGW-Spirochaetae-7]
MNNETLAEGLAELGLPSSSDTMDRLGRYVEAIEKWNPAWGLVGASGDELVVKHILDSLAPISIIRRCIDDACRSGARPSLVDLGTGAGLPGIPLAIAMPDIDVTLLDRMTRRIRFLEAMQAELPLGNVGIVEEQVERAKGSFDIVTFRAFRPFERKLFKRVFAVCAPGGFVIAYKGKADRARAELPAIGMLFSNAEIEAVKVPFLDDERCVVVMKPARVSDPRRSP